MSSKKEEERNEKIIRGLMKLPPNRRCINCNSMGPQYVCTNFWTFVCMTCSGIHREFTHRVKSVSMAKFTSQEVEALQKGGNQRAREIYFKLWDPQRHRLPDNSNADKVRELIKNVYLDKKYVGGSSSRDLQNSRNDDEESRRASSYHSYSQSPPYDFQYEERRYGKHAPVLTRKPGSDRGLYEGKISSFLSPSRLRDHSRGRLSDHVYEDSFALDPFRSNIQSPNLQRDFGSPTSEFPRDHSSEDIVQFTRSSNTDSPAWRSFGQMLYPQRTASLGSFGSVDSLSVKSVSSVGLVDATNNHELLEPHKDKKTAEPFIPQPSVIGSSDGMDLFNAPVAQDAISTLPQTSTTGTFGGLDLFSAPFAQQSDSSSTIAGNVSQSLGLSSTQFSNSIHESTAPTASTHQHPQPSLSSSVNMFPKSSEPFAVKFSDEPLHFIPQNEGWATFETPQNVVPLGTASTSTSEMPTSDANPVKNFDPLLSVGPWPSFKDTSTIGTSSVLLPHLNANLQSTETTRSTSIAESWNAFEYSFENLGERMEQNAVHQSPFSDQYPPIESKEGHGIALKSTNPFDLPYDGETNSEDMSQFFELSAFQAALPIVQAPSPFTAGANQHWFSEDAVAPYVQTGSEGVLGYIAGQAQSSQISNVSSHGPVASVGGNPFA